MITSCVFLNSCLSTNSRSVTDEENVESETKYSTLELLEIEGHPHLFDDYSNVEGFYDKISDSRSWIGMDR